MGIKGFSQIFKAVKTVKIKDLKGKTLAIDAFYELYRASLGGSSVSLLTDKYGKPTMHINVILAIVIDLQKNNVGQYWVFDHESDDNSEFHNPAKVKELIKRKAKKEEARKKLEELNQEVLFSDDEEDTDATSDKNSSEKQKISLEKQKNSFEKQKNSLEKQNFTVSKEIINDIKLIFNFLHIRYIDSPASFEAEHTCAIMNKNGHCDGVYSGDTDPIPFGALVQYRKNRDKNIYMYTREDILNQIMEANESFKPTKSLKVKGQTHINKPCTKIANLEDIQKICAMAGWDNHEKTPGIGPKTILKKYHNVELTDEQKKVVKEFKKEYIGDLEVNNLDSEPFVGCDFKGLLDWLSNERSFARSRIINQLKKVTDVKLE